MKKREDKKDFYDLVHKEYVSMHQFGSPRRLRDMFRKAKDSYEQNYIYSLLCNDNYGVCRYIKTKDLFSVDKSKLDPGVESNIDLLSKLFNHYKYVPKGLDLSHGGKFGYVYILKNKSMPGLLKIGYTCGSAFERASQLSNTSVAYSFEVCYLARVRKPDIVEKEVHQVLDIYRVCGDREFFEVSLEKAVDVIELCAPYLKKQDSSQKFF